MRIFYQSLLIGCFVAVAPTGWALAGVKLVIPARSFVVKTADGKPAAGVPIQYSVQVQKFGFFVKAPTPIPLPQWRPETLESRLFYTDQKGEVTVPEQAFASSALWVKQGVFRVDFPHWETTSNQDGLIVTQTHQIEGEFEMLTGQKTVLWSFTVEERQLESDLKKFPNPLQITLGHTAAEWNEKLFSYQQSCIQKLGPK